MEWGVCLLVLTGINDDSLVPEDLVCAAGPGVGVEERPRKVAGLSVSFIGGALESGH